MLPPEQSQQPISQTKTSEQGPALLAEATVESLNDLFTKDPEQLTLQDRGRIVEALRKAREQWAAAEAAGQTKGRRAPAVQKQAVQGTGPSLDDLGL